MGLAYGSSGSSNLGNNWEIIFQTHFAHHQSKVDRNWGFWNQRVRPVFMLPQLKFSDILTSADRYHMPPSGVMFWIPWEIRSLVSLSSCLPSHSRPRPPKSQYHAIPSSWWNLNVGVSMPSPQEATFLTRWFSSVMIWYNFYETLRCEAAL